MAVFQSIRELFAAAPAREPEIVVPAPATRYSIRPLTSKDLRELLHLNLRCFTNGDNYTKHTFNYLLNDPHTVGYRIVAEGGKMAGFIFAMVNPDGAAHITTIGVAPEHRRRGLALVLLAHVETVLKAKGLSTVVLEVRVKNTAAQSLYRLAGYTAVQRMPGYYSNGEDGYLMTKSLI